MDLNATEAAVSVMPDARQIQLTRDAATFSAERLVDPAPPPVGTWSHRWAWDRCAEYGLLRMLVPTEYGGTERRLADLVAVMEGLAYGGADQGCLFAINAHLWTVLVPLIRYGTDQQRARYLPALSDGSLIGANATTEQHAGSDVYALRTRAARDGDHYILNGDKNFVTNGPCADVFIIYATIDPRSGPLGVTAFIVDAATPGLRIGLPRPKMGLHGASLGQLVLDDCRIPATQRLGPEGRGAQVFEHSMEHERGLILAPCLGAMQRQLDRCISYARSRQQSGRPIGAYQAVAHRIADMQVRLDAARALLYRVAALKDSGRDAAREAAVAKLYVSEAYVQSSLDAIRVHGGAGYLTETGIEADHRNAIASLIYSGTSDIQRNLIARTLRLATASAAKTARDADRKDGR